MTRTIRLTGVALLAALAVAPGLARAQARNGAGGGEQDRDAGKRVTVRGVIAAVAVEGETVIDYATRRAAVAEAAHLTIIGSPVDDKGRDKDRDKDNDQARSRDDRSGSGRQRHNIYVVWLTPTTEIRDATGTSGGDRDKGKPGSNRAAFDKLEVGDRVEVTFVRRDLSGTGGGDAQARRHGRHRTYFGDAVSITILAEPTPSGDADRSRPGDRDDDRDKVKKP
jgi:hypothetical protein